MNTSNLENSKRLYELSGWVPEDTHDDLFTPAYDLGFMLRKLPDRRIDMHKHSSTSYSASWQPPRYGARRIWGIADTPEDACAQLLISLLEQKVIEGDR